MEKRERVAVVFLGLIAAAIIGTTVAGGGSSAAEVIASDQASAATPTAKPKTKRAVAVTTTTVAPAPTTTPTPITEAPMQPAVLVSNGPGAAPAPAAQPAPVGPKNASSPVAKPAASQAPSVVAPAPASAQLSAPAPTPAAPPTTKAPTPTTAAPPTTKAPTPTTTTTAPAPQPKTYRAPMANGQLNMFQTAVGSRTYNISLYTRNLVHGQGYYVQLSDNTGGYLSPVTVCHFVYGAVSPSTSNCSNQVTLPSGAVPTQYTVSIYPDGGTAGSQQQYYFSQS